MGNLYSVFICLEKLVGKRGLTKQQSENRRRRCKSRRIIARKSVQYVELLWRVSMPRSVPLSVRTQS